MLCNGFFSAVQGDGITYFCLIVCFSFANGILLGIIPMAQINLNKGLFQFGSGRSVLGY